MRNIKQQGYSLSRKKGMPSSSFIAIIITFNLLQLLLLPSSNAFIPASFPSSSSSSVASLGAYQLNGEDVTIHASARPMLVGQSCSSSSSSSSIRHKGDAYWPLYARYTSRDSGDRRRNRGFKPKKKGGKPKGDEEEDGGGGGSPDGEEEVIEIAVDVEELMGFASNLEDALKHKVVKKKDVAAGNAASSSGGGALPEVILNATGLHWLLGQVAYDTGIRWLAIPGLGQMKESAALLPDDVEWILTSGVNPKSVRRIPSIHSLRAVYIQNIETAELLEQALAKEEYRLATREPLQKVSSSRRKFLTKRNNMGGGGRLVDGEAKLFKHIVLAPVEGSTASDVLTLATAIRETCPRLVIWGLSVEKCPEAVEAVNGVRSFLGVDPKVILPMEGAEPLAKAATKQSLAWESLLTVIQVEAPLIEELTDGIQNDDGEEDEEGGSEGDTGSGRRSKKDMADYDPLANEEDGLEEEALELLLQQQGLPLDDQEFVFDFEDDDDDEEEEEEESSYDDYAEDDIPSPTTSAAADAAAANNRKDGQVPDAASTLRGKKGPVSKGRDNTIRRKPQTKKKGKDEEEDEGGGGGAFGSGLDRKGW